jgi:hypothetical protein
LFFFWLGCKKCAQVKKNGGGKPFTPAVYKYMQAPEVRHGTSSDNGLNT